eukprot:345133-Pleurochrysis_carterae.AAC.5
MLRLHQSPLRLEDMQGSQKHASKGNSSKDIGISIVIPSFSRFATLQRVLVRLLLSRCIHSEAALAMLSHGPSSYQTNVVAFPAYRRR